MTTFTDHPAVAAYLARLDTLAAHLPPTRRAELCADLLEHLAEALPPGAGEADVRTALDRLGPPEDIISAESPAAPPLPASAPSAPRSTSVLHEALAVVFLTIGSFVPLIGWIVGFVLLWTSRRWTTGEKVLGSLVTPGGPAAAALVGLFLLGAPVTVCGTQTSVTTVEQGTDGSTTTYQTPAPASCSTGTNWWGIALLVTLVALFLAPFVVGIVLMRRAGRRAAAA